MPINNIGGGPPKPGGLSETTPADKPGEASSIKKPIFKEHIEKAAEAEKAADQLGAIIQQASSKIASGEISKQEAIEFILTNYREELLSGNMRPEVADRVIDHIREVITDDPAVESLLTGK
ncbi:MAG: hypothetical protein ABIJ56_07650 [Pseudomonadota bacterium]